VRRRTTIIPGSDSRGHESCVLVVYLGVGELLVGTVSGIGNAFTIYSLLSRLLAK
jgi:hypothetical protein